MELKLFKVYRETTKKEYYIVRAFCKEHAAILTAYHWNMQPSEMSLDYIDEFDENDNLEDIIIDHNYLSEKDKPKALNEIVEEYDESYEDIFGVIGDNFIVWGR